ncbi:MAG: ABC transporter permease [Bacillota bacterium]
MDDQATKRRSALSEFWRRFRKNRLAVAGLLILLLFILTAINASRLAPYSYSEQNLEERFLTPRKGHLLGTDNLGRDLLSRIIYGARISLVIGFSSIAISLLAGGVLGCLAGFYGGAIDTVIMRLMDMMLAVPSVLLAIVIAAVLGTGVFNLIMAIGIASIPSYSRIVRASILSIRGQEYVEAARLSGCSDLRLIVRHIIPNIMAPVIVQTTLSLGLAILNASSLSFLGLGVQAPMPEWGSMLAASRADMRNYPYLVIFPGLAIVLVVLALNMVGDGLRDALDPRMKS